MLSFIRCNSLVVKIAGSFLYALKFKHSLGRVARSELAKMANLVSKKCQVRKLTSALKFRNFSFNAQVATKKKVNKLNLRRFANNSKIWQLWLHLLSPSLHCKINLVETMLLRFFSFMRCISLVLTIHTVGCIFCRPTCIVRLTSNLVVALLLRHSAFLKTN